MVQIHQFSTGIKADRDPQGNWFSRGFTGQYMNATLSPIPEAVQRSIRNKEFAVAEGAYSQAAAIVARVLPGENPAESAWSVVATVTQGRDEYGRPFSAYRYFCCAGENTLWQLLAWLESQPQIPVFDPFDTPQVINFTPMSPQPTFALEGWQGWLAEQQIPGILKAGQFSGQPKFLHMLHELAIAKTGGQLIAWAYNVEALEQPRRFAVVQVASEKAEEMIRRSLSNSSQQAIAPVADEQAIKSAIKSLTNSSQMKPEVVQTIATALANPQMTPEYWREIFDGQGATKAIKQKLFSPQTVRLLTLRAIVLPETLPSFVVWLNPALSNKQNEHSQTSIDFQKGLAKKFPSEFVEELEHRLSRGFEALLMGALNGVPVDPIAWTLIPGGCIWSQSRYLDRLTQDLQPVRSGGTKADPVFNTLWKELEKRGSLGYQSFAEFFKKLADSLHEASYRTQKVTTICYQLSAYFYHKANSRVPDDVFVRAFSSRRESEEVFGTRVYKEVTVIEQVLRFLEQNSAFILLFLLFLALTTGVLYLFDIPPFRAKKSSEKIAYFTPYIVKVAKLEIAQQSFYEPQKSCFAIKAILDEFKENTSTSELEIKQTLIRIFADAYPNTSILEVKDFDKMKTCEEQGKDRLHPQYIKYLVTSIYSYQDKKREKEKGNPEGQGKKPNPDGIIDNKPGGTKQDLVDDIRGLIPNVPSSPPEPKVPGA